MYQPKGSLQHIVEKTRSCRCSPFAVSKCHSRQCTKQTPVAIQGAVHQVDSHIYMYIMKCNESCSGLTNCDTMTLHLPYMLCHCVCMDCKLGCTISHPEAATTRVMKCRSTTSADSATVTKPAGGGVDVVVTSGRDVRSG